jgi:ATP-dependent Clp protease ATP-binding subunit ClpC
VILLDEIEKAHPDVFNILLQVLDEGHLTDNYGRVIDFKNTVLIMTSNLGARNIAKSGLGFQQADAKSSYESMRDKVNEEIHRAFNPEFLNRVDDTIVFHPLSRAELGEIVHIMLGDLESRLAQGGMSLRLTEGAIDFLVTHGHDEKYGARPLKRAIRRHLEDPLSERILMAEFGSGDEIEVDVEEDGEALAIGVASPTKT